jgi:hypothetical protein
MKLFKICIAALFIVWTATLWHLEMHQVHAQSAQAYTMAGSAAHTTCVTPAVGSYFLCVATDGIWVSNNGAAYFQILPPTSTTGTVTSVNSIKPDSTGNVTLAIPSTAALPSQTLTLK